MVRIGPRHEQYENRTVRAYGQWRIQELPKADHGERAEREPKWGSGGGAPSWVQSEAPEAESLLYILYKKWPKVNDFFFKFAAVSESRRNDQP